MVYLDLETGSMSISTRSVCPSVICKYAFTQWRLLPYLVLMCYLFKLYLNRQQQWWMRFSPSKVCRFLGVVFVWLGSQRHDCQVFFKCLFTLMEPGIQSCFSFIQICEALASFLTFLIALNIYGKVGVLFLPLKV